MSTSRTAALMEKIRAAQLLDATQQARADRLAQITAGDDRDLAQALVEQKLLTRFQADQLLAEAGARLVFGRYVVLDRLGGGGMGEVFKARDRRMDRIVALKVVHQRSRDDPQAHARFLQEVRASAKLNHPNIVRAYDTGEADDRTYLVLEYVDGRSLYQIIRDERAVEPARAAYIAYQVALALDHAHHKEIIHRDIKPSNILVDTGGTVKVLDMGLARISHDDAEASMTLTRDGVVMGTVDYLAPEQAMDTHKADIRADIYSLGCTLYHMLTGQVPFPGGSTTEKLVKHQMKEPAPIRQLAPHVPEGLAAVVGRMMAKRADDRFQTPQELAQALLPWARPLIAGPPTVIKPPTAPSPVVSVDQSTPPAVGQEAIRRPAEVGREPPSSKSGGSGSSTFRSQVIPEAAGWWKAVSTAFILLGLAVVGTVGVIALRLLWPGSGI